MIVLTPAERHGQRAALVVRRAADHRADDGRIAQKLKAQGVKTVGYIGYTGHLGRHRLQGDPVARRPRAASRS
jgi:hypothetical protein